MSVGSSAAEHLRKHKSDVLTRWEQRVRRHIEPMRSREHPILIDTMPVFVDTLCEALSADDPRETADEGNTIPEEHGAERARLITAYAASDIVLEYQLLRRTLFEMFADTGHTLAIGDLLSITTSIDDAVRDSLNAFLATTGEVEKMFSAALAHDLRTPLGAARIAADLILRRPDDRERHPTYALRIIENIDRASRMIADLLDAHSLRMGKRLAPQLAPVELRALLEETVTQASLQYGPRFVTRIQGERIDGFWNASSLQRAVENLLTNAVKYGSETEPITLTAHADHGRAIISVHNFGAPIPPEEMQHLFMPFTRSSAARSGGQRGWGIGLALVKGTAEAHGGSATVDSVPEKGTTFTIDIPLDPRVAMRG